MLQMWLEWQDIFWPTLKALAALPSFPLLSTNLSGFHWDQFFLRKDDNDEFLFRCCCYPSASLLIFWPLVHKWHRGSTSLFFYLILNEWNNKHKHTVRFVDERKAQYCLPLYSTSPSSSTSYSASKSSVDRDDVLETASGILLEHSWVISFQVDATTSLERKPRSNLGSKAVAFQAALTLSNG